MTPSAPDQRTRAAGRGRRVRVGLVGGAAVASVTLGSVLALQAGTTATAGTSSSGTSSTSTGRNAGSTTSSGLVASGSSGASVAHSTGS